MPSGAAARLGLSWGGVPGVSRADANRTLVAAAPASLPDLPVNPLQLAVTCRHRQEQGRVELALRLVEHDPYRVGVRQRQLVLAAAAQGVVDVGYAVSRADAGMASAARPSG